MKSILMSIQPKWVEKIISGEKTIEVRKTAPKQVPFKVYIYCTKGNTKIYLGENRIFHTNCAYDFETGGILENILINGKVIGEFICNKVDTISVYNEVVYSTGNLFADKLKSMCLTVDELKYYLANKSGYALGITDLKIYDKPRELGEFRKPDTSCGFYNPDLERCDSGYNCERCVYNDLTITRPPQSWQYVGEIEE